MNYKKLILELITKVTDQRKLKLIYCYIKALVD